MNGFWNNFIGMFFGWPSIKIAKMVSLRWTKLSPELKIEKKKKQKKTTFKRHLLLGQWPDFKIISQNCSLGDPLPNFLNGSAPLNKMAIKAKTRKTKTKNKQKQKPPKPKIEKKKKKQKKKTTTTTTTTTKNNKLLNDISSSKANDPISK